MSKEIERKYLVKNDMWRKDAGPGVLYRQGYLSTDPERSVRVRVAGDKAFLTIKGKTQGAARDEFEYPIPTEDGEQLLRTLCVNRRVRRRKSGPRPGGSGDPQRRARGRQAGVGRSRSHLG